MNQVKFLYTLYAFKTHPLYTPLYITTMWQAVTLMDIYQVSITLYQISTPHNVFENQNSWLFYVIVTKCGCSRQITKYLLRVSNTWYRIKCFFEIPLGDKIFTAINFEISFQTEYWRFKLR